MVIYMYGLPWWLNGKEYACNVGDLGSIPGLGRSPGEKKGYLLQDSGLENGVVESQTGLSDFHFKVFIECVTVLHLFYVLAFWL